MTQAMKISLSNEVAEACWGQKALLSSNGAEMCIHLKENLSYRERLSTIQRAARKIDRQGIRQVALVGAAWDLEKSWAFWQGYRDPKGKQYLQWSSLKNEDQVELANRLKIINWVRDTINAPAEELGPEQLADRAISLLYELAAEHLTHEIIQGDALQEKGYMGLHTVGRGSARRPIFLALDYNPSKDTNTPVHACLVGKGITFDSGGYSLKPSSGMDSMKADMGGAAMLTGALALAIKRGLKKRVKLYLCCADNMVSGNAFRLGDIIRYRNGKTVEVMNTDAEGRLVLADGLIDASEQNPSLLIDAATLTGAAKTALGNDYHALFTFDDDLARALLDSADKENESFWRLPLEKFHRSYLTSGFADINNVAPASCPAGASTAAAFLSYFVSRYQKGWLHLDCSATYHKSPTEQWSIGATGLGVRTLATLLLNPLK